MEKQTTLHLAVSRRARFTRDIKPASLISVTAGRHEEGEVRATRLLLENLGKRAAGFYPGVSFPLSGNHE